MCTGKNYQQQHSLRSPLKCTRYPCNRNRPGCDQPGSAGRDSDDVPTQYDEYDYTAALTKADN